MHVAVAVGVCVCVCVRGWGGVTHMCKCIARVKELQRGGPFKTLGYSFAETSID